MSVYSLCSDGYCCNISDYSNDGENMHHETCKSCKKKVTCASYCKDKLCQKCCSKLTIKYEKILKCKVCEIKFHSKSHCGIKLCSFEDICIKCHKDNIRKLKDQKKIKYNQKNPYIKCIGCDKHFRKYTLNRYDGEHCGSCYNSGQHVRELKEKIKSLKKELESFKSKK